MRNRTTIWVIGILLAVCVLMSGYGLFVHIDRVNHPPAENPNKEFKFNGKLFFYDINKELINTYKCKNEYCDYASNRADDYTYMFNYYKDSQEIAIPLIDQRYAFINDSASKSESNIILYDVKNQKEVNKFKSVKNYTIGLDNGYFIVQDENGKYGVIKTTNNAGMIIECKYDFIGVRSEINSDTGHLKSDKFAVQDVNGWKMISDTGTDLTSYTTRAIFDYNDSFTITYSNGNYYLTTSNGNELMSDGIEAMRFVGNYVEVMNDEDKGYFVNLSTMQEVTSRYEIKDLDSFIIEESLNGYEIYYGDELIATLK